MVKITITTNEGNQRLDRFLKKYLKNAPLSHIYKLIRKDVKVNGRRAKADRVLLEGDQLELYISPDQIEADSKARKTSQPKRQFAIAYEDAHTLIVEKPFGLLTHGDRTEKKNTLANQVCGYLQEQGVYDPSQERTFVPSPVNRLDRNTTGLVIFGKTSASLQLLNQLIREREHISKYYLTIVAGQMTAPLFLTDKMEKAQDRNRIRILSGSAEGGKWMQTAARPLEYKDGYTLVEVELITGRTHQIRAHLGEAGFPVIGDGKYGNAQINKKCKQNLGLHTQLLHAYKLVFHSTPQVIEGLGGRTIAARLPQEFQRIKTKLFD